MARHQERKIGFKSVQLLKDQSLGIGSYGTVYKAKCDDLLCAAKILHPMLFDPTAHLQVSRKQEHRLPIKRFEQECEFLSTIQHPNIVQYLCMHQDPDTGLPVLLMELMDEGLTHFLKSSPQPIAYHIEVNICHDITLALSFLHSNDIIHRDLSSNNVLLRGNVLAKVTDFGMATLGDLNPQATRNTFTMCPGTDVYMPPEAVKDNPVYNEKVDCFSFGVITIQIVTRQFPLPGNRQVPVNDPRYPPGTLKMCVPEVNRRQNHISQVDPSHPLLPIALHCLKDKDTERPSAQQLCERMANLKERPEYSDSVAVAQERRQLRQQPQQREIEEKERQLRQLREQLQQLQQSSAREREEAQEQIRQQLHQLQQILENEQKLERLLYVHREEIEQLTRAKDERERQLESSEQERNELEKRLHNLEKELLAWRNQAKKPQLHLKAADDKVDKRDNIKLRWREGRSALFASSRWCDAIVDGNRVYALDGSYRLWVYDINDIVNRWLQLSKAPVQCPGFVILNGLPTTIGGIGTNKLMSFTVEEEWTEKFPPMPTERYFVSAVCTRTDLIVAGGTGKDTETLTTVEVLNIEKSQWSTAIDLPEPVLYHSVTVHGDQLYMLGGTHGRVPAKSAYTCSVSALLQTCMQRSLVGTLKHALSISGSNSSSGASRSIGVWSELPNLPVSESTCVTFCGQLLAVGGRDSDNKPTTAVFMYNRDTNSWNVISHMTTARRQPFAVVLPNNQVMVVGGQTKIDNRWTISNFVEFGHLC